MLRATLGEPVPIQIQLTTGQDNLFPRAKIYDISGTLFNTVSLPHLDNGLYGTEFTFNTPGYYTLVYQVFNDSGFTSATDYEIEAETVEANSDKTNITRILGLTHDNTLIDNQTYDFNGNLLSARIRSYDSKAHALTGGVSGLLNTWTVSATYDGDRLQTYRIVRES